MRIPQCNPNELNPILDRSSESEDGNVLDAIIEVGNARRDLMLKMKAAVEHRDLEQVFACAEALTHEDKSSQREKSH